MKRPLLVGKFKSFRLFFKAMSNTRHEMWVTVQVLIVITVVLAIVLWIVESSVQSEFNFWGSLTWPFMQYIEDPGGFADYRPVTIVGRIIAVLVGIIGIAIFAVPAGLIGSGFMDAIAEDKREEELAGFRRRMQKAFRRSSNKGLREYLNSLPDGGGEAFKTLNIAPQYIPVAKMHVRQGMDMKDIIDTCNKFEEFRLKNLADAHSTEDDAEDRFVVEHFPLNRKYGCCIPRDSKVTIVCTSSFDEVGIGWFSYYLAKMGGFNYISKEVEVDPDELDSYYNLSPEPLYDKKPVSAYDKKKDKEAFDILQKKLENREQFLDDLKQEVNDGSWVIIITEHLKTMDNQADFHFADCLKDGSLSTVNDQEAYQLLYNNYADGFKNEFALESAFRSPRYPLLKKNLGYTIRKDIANANVFVLRPSSELINFNDRKLAIAYRMATIISQQLDGGRGIQEKDTTDLKETGFGYGKIEYETTETTI